MKLYAAFLTEYKLSITPLPAEELSELYAAFHT